MSDLHRLDDFARRVLQDNDSMHHAVPVEPDYYEVETDGTSLSGSRFRVVPERPVGPIYGYSPEPLERYAVYRVRLTDGEADDE